MKLAIMLTLFTPILSFNLAAYFIQNNQLEFIEEKLRALGTHQPFLTRTRFQKINEDFLTQLSKPRADKHSYQHKPDKSFHKMLQEKMVIYMVMKKLFNEMYL